MKTNNSSTYQSLSIEDSIETAVGVEVPDRKVLSGYSTVLFSAVTLLTFMFYGYFVFRGLVPAKMLLEKHSDVGRRLAEDAVTVSCTVSDVAVMTTAGAVVGTLAVVGAFALIGLTPVGPIAGAWFATNMGAGLVSGSTMAIVQSAAMTGTVYGTGAAVGGAVGAVGACA